MSCWAATSSAPANLTRASPTFFGALDARLLADYAEEVNVFEQEETLRLVNEVEAFIIEMRRLIEHSSEDL